LLVDWFGKLNGKLGSDLDKIQIAGRLMIETFKALGIMTSQKGVEFL